MLNHLDPLDPVNQLLRKWEKSSFLKLKKLRKEIKAEQRWHQKKHDFSYAHKLPLEGWGRSQLRESANKANEYFKYRKLLKESLEDAQQIIYLIKGLDSLFEWDEVQSYKDYVEQFIDWSDPNLKGRDNNDQ